MSEYIMNPKYPSILLSLSVLTISCAPKETTVKGIVVDASMNTIAVSSQGDTLRFSTSDAEKTAPNGILLQDSATVLYQGAYSEGMPAVKIEVTSRNDSSLGAWLTRTYEGVLPAASGPGIRYSLTIRNREYSGDGTFTLVMTYLEAEKGQDCSFTYTGKRFTQRGIPGNDNATVWQLISDDKKETFNFLRENEETLTLLNDRFEPSKTGLNYSLKLVK